MKKVIGLTGGIASGKSTVVDFLIAQGYRVIDADKVVRELQEPGGALYQGILETFGADYFNENGALDRAKLGALVFDDKTQRDKLSALQDQIIREALYQRRDQMLSVMTENEILFMDIPLLIEYKYTGFDEIWLVTVPEEVQLKRLMARNQLTEAAAKNRIAAQMPMEEKKKYADRILDNAGTVDSLLAQVKTALSALTEESVGK